MKSRVSLIYLITFSTGLTFCQREINIEIGNKNSCSSATLTKAISKINSDSLVTEFQYDANGRPSKHVSTYIGHRDIISSDLIVVRNTSGIIIDLISKTNRVQGTYLDTVHVFYDYNLNHYTHTIQRLDLSGFISNDSIVFIYDGANKLIGQDIYGHHFNPAPYSLLDNKLEFSYDIEGNLSKVSNYERDQSTNVLGLRSVTLLSYDNNQRAREIDNRDAVILSYPHYALHNVIMEETTDLKFPTNNQTLTYQYSYNECKRPTTMVVTSNRSSYVRKVWYYYK